MDGFPQQFGSRGRGRGNRGGRGGRTNFTHQNRGGHAHRGGNSGRNRGRGYTKRGRSSESSYIYPTSNAHVEAKSYYKHSMIQDPWLSLTQAMVTANQLDAHELTKNFGVKEHAP